MPSSQLGVFLLGIRGGLATTTIVGARAVARGLSGTTGLVTETPPFRALGFAAAEDLVFGGCDIRRTTAFEAAREALVAPRIVDGALVESLRKDLDEIDRRVTLGTAMGCGEAVRALASGPWPPAEREPRRRDPGARRVGRASSRSAADPRARPASSARASEGVGGRSGEATRGRGEAAEAVRGIEGDLRRFRDAARAERVVVVNLASTEPPLESAPWQEDPERLDRVLAGREPGEPRASTMYALAAARAGCAYLNFTPSNGALLPAVRARFEEARLPWAGDDGKTGETLVKSALAPLFLWRNLRVLSWFGYNLLGDRDGQVLADSRNRESKLQTKHEVLAEILGYSPESRVGIDYVPSLGDRKTAWDFVHFEGFLGHRMSLEFSWHGCDSILGAPLVLDLVRFLDFSLRRGQGGPQAHLGFYFKRPLAGGPADLAAQFRALVEYASPRARR